MWGHDEKARNDDETVIMEIIEMFLKTVNE